MFICHCVRPSSQWKWVWKQRSCSQRKQETKSDLSSMMGCLVVTGHLLTAGCLFHQAPSAGTSLPSLSPLLCQDSTAQDRSTGLGLSWRGGVPPVWQLVGLSSQQGIVVASLWSVCSKAGRPALRCPCRHKCWHQISISVSRETEDRAGHVNDFLAKKHIRQGRGARLWWDSCRIDVL